MESSTKACMFCAEQIQPAAVVCRFCNREQVTPKAADDEALIFEGRASHAAYAFAYGACAVLSLFLIGVPLAIGIYLHVRTTVWRVTNRRIQIEKGILVRTIDSMELWRVRDLRFVQSLPDRMLDQAAIHVVSTDATTPAFDMRGIPNARALFDRLKTEVDAAKRDRRVMSIDQ